MYENYGRVNWGWYNYRGYGISWPKTYERIGEGRVQCDSFYEREGRGVIW